MKGCHVKLTKRRTLNNVAGQECQINLSDKYEIKGKYLLGRFSPCERCSLPDPRVQQWSTLTIKLLLIVSLIVGEVLSMHGMQRVVRDRGQCFDKDTVCCYNRFLIVAVRISDRFMYFHLNYLKVKDFVRINFPYAFVQTCLVARSQHRHRSRRMG